MIICSYLFISPGKSMGFPSLRVCWKNRHSAPRTSPKIRESKPRRIRVSLACLRASTPLAMRARTGFNGSTYIFVDLFVWLGVLVLLLLFGVGIAIMKLIYVYIYVSNSFEIFAVSGLGVRTQLAHQKWQSKDTFHNLSGSMHNPGANFLE